MQKLIATMTVTVTYTPDPNNYPPGSTIDDMMEIDKGGLEEDPDLFFSDDNAIATVNIEKG